VGATSREIRIAAAIDRVWEVVVGFEAYPGFVPGVRACRVVGGAPGRPEVEYEVDLGVRAIRYVLSFREERPRRLSWSLVRGELFTRSDGTWELSPEGDGTLARYTVDVEVSRPPLVPRFVVDRVVDELTRVQLPRMLEAFKARAEER
jgi:ribosome-associated toxin RatA of RatAB toxin-antitoxin module